MHCKLSPVGEDTNRGGSPWAASPPRAVSLVMLQIGLHHIISIHFFIRGNIRGRKNNSRWEKQADTNHTKSVLTLLRMEILFW